MLICLSAGIAVLALSAALAFAPTHSETTQLAPTGHTVSVRCGIPVRVLVGRRPPIDRSDSLAKNAQAVCRDKAEDRVRAAAAAGAAGGGAVALAVATQLVARRGTDR